MATPVIEPAGAEHGHASGGVECGWMGARKMERGRMATPMIESAAANLMCINCTYYHYDNNIYIIVIVAEHGHARDGVRRRARAAGVGARSASGQWRGG